MVEQVSLNYMCHVRIIFEFTIDSTRRRDPDTTSEALTEHGVVYGCCVFRVCLCRHFKMILEVPIMKY